MIVIWMIFYLDDLFDYLTILFYNLRYQNTIFVREQAIFTLTMESYGDGTWGLDKGKFPE